MAQAIQESSAVDPLFGFIPECSSTPEDGKHVYRMDHIKRGYFIIINNEKFDPATELGPRHGTQIDAANLYHRFKVLGFHVRRFDNMNKIDMLNVMKEESNRDHSDYDCFGCAILSHGDEGVVYGTDGQISLENLLLPFKHTDNQTLRGKPKIFIIQACRGEEEDEGCTLQADAEVPGEYKVCRLPLAADFIYAYSTVEGYASWRDTSKGSYFIQALCKMLRKYAYKLDFVHILTRVNHELAHRFESMDKMKQMPSFVSLLTKELIFNKKK